MAKNDPLFGDIKAKRVSGLNIDPNVAWSAAAGGGIEGGQGGAYSGYIPGLETSVDTEGNPLIGQGDFADWSSQNPGGSYIDFATTQGLDFDEASSVINNPAFAAYYNQFADTDSDTWQASSAADWWGDYGRYFTGLDKPGAKQALTQRKGNIEKEGLRLKALNSLDKTKGFSGKTGFAGDGGFAKAQKSLQEEAMRQSDLSKLGVETSLWDVHQNYMSNMYDQFAALAGLGAFDDE